MDPNIMKFLEEDEDESMHSGADVAAFSAELNRDIEGNTSTLLQRSDSAALCQGSSQTKSQFLQPWQTSTYNGICNLSSGENLMLKEQNQHHSTQLEQQQVESNSQLHKLQDISSQHSNNQRSMTSSDQQVDTTTSKSNKQVPLGLLLQIIQPQLDKDRVMHVHNLYFRLKKNEISKDGFFRHMRSIVGDQMLRLAAYKLQNHHSPDPFQSQPQASARKLQMSSTAQKVTHLNNPTNDSNKGKSLEVDKQADSLGMHTSYPAYGSANASSSTSIRLHHPGPQIRPGGHQSMTVNHLGPTTQSMNLKSVSSSERTHSFNDPKKMQVGAMAHMNSNLLHWPLSTSKEQKIGVSSSMTYVKPELIELSNEQEYRPQMSSSNGLSSSSSARIKQHNAALGNLKDESFNIESSRTRCPPSNSLSSTSRTTEARIPPKSLMPSPSVPVNNSKATLEILLVGQKKPTEAPGSSSPSSSKKQKVSGAFLDQSIEQLNDVTAVSGVNLRGEEEQLFSGAKEDSRVSETCRRIVQEEEEKLIFHKVPLQKKVIEIMANYGLKDKSSDVERCLSLCVEERMHGFICNLVRLSKQHADIEKQRHRTIITSDVRQQILKINRNAREEWERKQAETENSQLNDSESPTGVNGDNEKEESCVRSAKVNKEEDDKMRTTAANVAVRAATGVGDMLSRWQLMIEAKQKKGGNDTSYGSQPGKDTQKPLTASIRITSENQEAGLKEMQSAAFDSPALVRKVGQNQLMVPRVARSITVKDVISILEREPQMSKSTLIYRLYHKVSADAVGE